MGKKGRKGNFFEEDTPHGIGKRTMYKKYLQPYIEVTQYDFKTMIIDGFAGAGRYSKEWPAEIESYGSPLIALMIALENCHRKEQKELKDKNREISGGIHKQSGPGGAGHEKKESLEEFEKPGPSNNKKIIERNDKRGSSQENGAALQEYEASSSATSEELMQDDNTNNKATLWGWPTSNCDPMPELECELNMMNRRTSYCKDSAEESKLSLIFIETDPDWFKDLATNVELLLIHFLKRFYPSFKYGFLPKKKEVRLNLKAGLFSISIKILNRKFAEFDPPSALHEKFVRSLTFLDPFGFTHSPMAHTAKFAPGPGNEVLINFMSSYVNRFVSRNTEGVVQAFGVSNYELKAFFHGKDLPDVENENSLVDYVTHYIHFCKPENEHLFSNKINKVAKNYEEVLKRKTNSEYSLTFEVKGKGNTTIYHMVHITNHIRGVEVMKEAMKRCSQKEGEMIMSDYDILIKGQKLNLGNMDNPEKVAETIFNRFRGEKRVKLDIIQQYILFETNYLFRKTPLKKLQQAGKITNVVDTNDEPPKRKFHFPAKDIKTEKPIEWLITFADEEYSAENPNSVYAIEVEERSSQKEEKKAKDMKSQRLLTDIYARTNSDQRLPLGNMQNIGDGDTNENENKVTGSELTFESDERQSSSSKKKPGKLSGKENSGKPVKQRQTNEMIMPQKVAEADNKSIEGGANQTRKRKSSEKIKGPPVKKACSSTHNLDQSSSDNTLNRNSKRDDTLSQRHLMEFFQPHNI